MIKLTYPDQKAAFAIFLTAVGQSVVEYPASGEVMIPAGLQGPLCMFSLLSAQSSSY